VSWWTKRSKTFDRQNQTVRLPRLDDHVPKMNDPQCVACYLQNDSDVPLTIVSQLEKYYPQLIEAKDFISFELNPGEKKLVPHCYFDLLPYEAERKVTRIGIGHDHPPVEFVYNVRKSSEQVGIEQVSFASSDSQPANSGMKS